MNPSTRLRVGLRAALRRRYAYAALRVLRRASAAAWSAHVERSIGPRPYNGTVELRELRRLYAEALRRLRRRFPAIDPSDPRAAL